MRITKDDSTDLDFVIQCLMTGAIDMLEFRAWCDHVMAEVDEIPEWMLDLSELEWPVHIYRILGFVPGGSDSSEAALAGIALARGRDIDTSVRSAATARRALIRNSTVQQRFNRTFPFLGQAVDSPPKPGSP